MAAARAKSYRLGNAELRATILDYGGIVQSLEFGGTNVVIGFADAEDYRRQAHPYFGALIGRFGNRIAHGTFELDGKRYQVPCNDGANSLHGGSVGFDKLVWDVVGSTERTLELHLVSADGDQGYPGTLDVSVTYQITDDDGLRIDYLANTDAPTVLNLTNHAYFNLAGIGLIRDHRVWINADHYLPVDDALIPTGEILEVARTPFDLRAPVAMQREYDHCFVMNGWDGTLRLQARVVEPASGRTLEVLTTEPGLQFYTGNMLDGSVGFPRGAAFCLETQHFPDAPNHLDFPSTVLRPGETFRSSTVYRFSRSNRG